MMMVKYMSKIDLIKHGNYENEHDNLNKNYRVHIHVIEKGDTLYKLARIYDIKLTDIMRLNPYVNVYNLNIGDELLIPGVDKND